MKTKLAILLSLALAFGWLIGFFAHVASPSNPANASKRNTFVAKASALTMVHHNGTERMLYLLIDQSTVDPIKLDEIEAGGNGRPWAIQFGEPLQTSERP